VRRWTHNWPLSVVVIGLVVTAGLTIASAELAASNERHLLKLRAKEVGSLLTATLPDIQTPIGAAVALADTNGIDNPKLRDFVAEYAGPDHEFASLSIWRIGALNKGPVEVFGAYPELHDASPGAAEILRGATRRNGITVHGELHEKVPRVAYAYAGAHPGRYIVEAETSVPAGRYVNVSQLSAYSAYATFSNVNAAVYIGHLEPSRLWLTNSHTLPLPGRSAWTTISFGGDTLFVGVSAKEPLGGAFPDLMPWIIAVLGSLLTLGAAVLTHRLIVGRGRAQDLADENRVLYAEQHGIAQSLQHALLPEELPTVEGIRLAAIYDAGDPDVEIGGDWYDFFELDSDRLLLVVGDVTGRGIRAATAMASLRFAIKYAAHFDAPEIFLAKLAGAPGLREHGQLATVLCVVIELQARRVSVTSAGHLPPLLVHDGQGEFLQPQVGPPVGSYADAVYVSTSFTVPDGATLIGFTDGLVERRGETLDAGLGRLHDVAVAAQGDLERVMAQILERVRGPESVDDTAIAGIQWVSQKQFG
jgi:hypothetical protein